MQDEMGPKGFKILSITHEPREQVLKYLAQGNPSPMTYTIGLQGGVALQNPTNGIPYSWLIAADGKVVWQGNGTPSEKAIQEELKKVRITPESKAAKAEKAIAYAETLIADKQVYRGVLLLDRVLKEHKGSEAAKKAEERKAALEKDEALKKELAAQKELDRMVGGLEMPKEKIKKKVRELTQTKLEAFIKANSADAPAAVESAKMLVKVMMEDWDKTAK